MSVFGNVLNWFQDRFQRDAEHRLAHFIPDGQAVLAPGEHYFRLWLDEMFLTDERRWFAEWHPAVHSAVTFSFGDQTDQVVTRIAGTSTLKDVDAAHLNRVVTQTLKLTELMPFNGGTIRINAALLAMKGSDDVRQLIDVFGEFSKKLAVPQLSLALDVALPLAQGVSALVGATNGEMMAGLDQTLAGDTVRAGSFAIVYATAADVPPAKLTIENRQLHFDGARLTGRHYMLLRIERLAARDDWEGLTSIREPYQRALDLLTEDQLEAAQTALKKAIGAALKSSDLTEVDRRRVIEALKQRYRDARDLLGAGAFADEAERSLTSLMEGAMPPSRAAAMGRMTAAEALQELDGG
jgi:hypothetical protein